MFLSKRVASISHGRDSRDHRRAVREPLALNDGEVEIGDPVDQLLIRAFAKGDWRPSEPRRIAQKPADLAVELLDELEGH